MTKVTRAKPDSIADAIAPASHVPLPQEGVEPRKSLHTASFTPCLAVESASLSLFSQDVHQPLEPPDKRKGILAPARTNQDLHKLQPDVGAQI